MERFIAIITCLLLTIDAESPLRARYRSYKSYSRHRTESETHSLYHEQSPDGLPEFEPNLDEEFVFTKRRQLPSSAAKDKKDRKPVFDGQVCNLNEEFKKKIDPFAGDEIRYDLLMEDCDCPVAYWPMCAKNVTFPNQCMFDCVNWKLMEHGEIRIRVTCVYPCEQCSHIHQLPNLQYDWENFNPQYPTPKPNIIFND